MYYKYDTFIFTYIDDDDDDDDDEDVMVKRYLRIKVMKEEMNFLFINKYDIIITLTFREMRDNLSPPFMSSLEMYYT